MHLDPSIYLMDDVNKSTTEMAATDSEEKSLKEDKTNGSTSISHSEHNEPEKVESAKEVSADELNKVTGTLESIDIAANVPEKKGYF